MEEVRFLYSVNPKKVIKNLSGVSIIRTPKSLQLTKEDVIECLKYGSVHRRFANENRIEKVTIDNVDRLHNAKYISEEEWKKIINDGGEVTGTVTIVDEPETIEEVVEETAEDTTEPVVEEEVVEEVLSEESVENTAEPEEVSEVEVSETIEEVVEETAEDTTEPVVEEDKVVNKEYNNNNHYKKKHKH